VGREDQVGPVGLGDRGTRERQTVRGTREDRVDQEIRRGRSCHLFRPFRLYRLCTMKHILCWLIQNCSTLYFIF